MGKPPCSQCRLFPCFRRSECPKYRKWDRNRKAELERIRIEKEKIAFFLDEMTQSVDRNTKRLRLRGKWKYREY